MSPRLPRAQSYRCMTAAHPWCPSSPVGILLSHRRCSSSSLRLCHLPLAGTSDTDIAPDSSGCQAARRALKDRSQKKKESHQKQLQTKATLRIKIKINLRAGSLNFRFHRRNAAVSSQVLGKIWLLQFSRLLVFVLFFLIWEVDREISSLTKQKTQTTTLPPKKAARFCKNTSVLLTFSSQPEWNSCS